MLSAVLACLLAAPGQFYLSPAGNDAWSGRLAAPNAARTDGPLATPAAAQAALRRAGGGMVVLRGGCYELPATLVFTPADSGTVWAAQPGERPVLSGGRRLRGWRVAGGRWVLDLPPGDSFTQLFVNGRRARRARSPNTGFYTMAGYVPDKPKTAFRYRAEDFPYRQPPAGAMVVAYHSWETSLHPVAGVDPATRTLALRGQAHWDFGRSDRRQRWYLENVPEALDAPGEWYLAPSGALTYLPRPGEDPATAEVHAARLERLVQLAGEPRLGLPVEGVTFRGLTFAHAAWTLEENGHSDPQAVCTAGAAIEATGARDCRFEDCRVVHTGQYGLWLRAGSRRCVVQRCELADLGAGAIRIGETARPASDALACGEHTVDNNWIHDYGEVYAGGVGIFVAQSSDNRITHNDIHDGRYSGMSIGWDWGRGPTAAHRNLIADNHIHHLVKGALSDAGGIYCLGTSPGTVLRHNLIHDLFSHRAPDYSWGLYLDAETNGVLVENNVTYHCEDVLMLHNGAHNNVVRNNILARAVNHLIWRSPASIPQPNTFTHNLCLVSQGELFLTDATPDTKSTWDENLYWRSDGQPLEFMGESFADWQALGLDRRSVVADPLFIDPERGDFRFKVGAKRDLRGFVPFALDGFGLYGDPEWVAGPRRVEHPPTVMPPPASSGAEQPFADDFEGYAEGDTPVGAHVSLGPVAGGDIAVSARQAASGKHSLAFTDAPGLRNEWDPHLFWQPRLRSGTARFGCKLYLEAGAVAWIEWRHGSYPYKVGPSLRIDAAGKLTANGRELTVVPRATWLTLGVVCVLGKAATGAYDLALRSGDGPEQVFQALPCDPGFRRVDWLGVVSLATQRTVFYLDDVKLAREP